MCERFRSLTLTRLYIGHEPSVLSLSLILF